MPQPGRVSESCRHPSWYVQELPIVLYPQNIETVLRLLVSTTILTYRHFA